MTTISAEQAGKRVAEGPPIDRLEVAAYTIPTDQPESDGTFAWNRERDYVADYRPSSWRAAISVALVGGALIAGIAGVVRRSRR